VDICLYGMALPLQREGVSFYGFMMVWFIYFFVFIVGFVGRVVREHTSDHIEGFLD
jgi:bacteriorhodopsin